MPPAGPPPGYPPPTYGAPGAPMGGGTGQSVQMDLKLEKTLTYALTWVTGLIFIFVEKENKEVRFHAWQSLIFFGGLTVARIVISILGGIMLGALFSLINIVISLAYVIVWIVMLIQTYQGNTVRLPVAADIADQQA